MPRKRPSEASDACVKKPRLCTQIGTCLCMADCLIILHIRSFPSSGLELDLWTILRLTTCLGFLPLLEILALRVLCKTASKLFNSPSYLPNKIELCVCDSRSFVFRGWKTISYVDFELLHQLKHIQLQSKEIHIHLDEQIVWDSDSDWDEDDYSSGSPSSKWTACYKFLERFLVHTLRVHTWPSTSRFPNSLRRLIFTGHPSRDQVLSTTFPNQLAGLYFRAESLGDDALGHMFQTTPRIANLNCVASSMVGTCLQYLSSSTMQSLNLECNLLLTDNGISILTKLTQLVRLNLGGCQKITDRSIGHIAQYLCLEKLSLRSCNLITDEGIAQLKHGSLRYLDVSHCRRLTNKALAGVVCLPLETLDISYCELITDKGLRYLSGLPLKELHMRGVNVTDAGLRFIADLPLEALFISRTRVSEKGLRHLCGSSLKVLDMSRTFVSGIAPLLRFPLVALNLYGSRISYDEWIPLLAKSQLKLVGLGGPYNFSWRQLREESAKRMVFNRDELLRQLWGYGFFHRWMDMQTLHQQQAFLEHSFRLMNSGTFVEQWNDYELFFPLEHSETGTFGR